MIDCGSREPHELAEAARRVLVPALLRRRQIETLEPLLLDPELERELTRSWTAGAPDPALAMYVRDQVEKYVQGCPAGRSAIVCAAAVRGVLADFLIRSGVDADIYSYAEIPAEITLLPRLILKQPAHAGP